jgi:hypothetical protein
LGKGTGRVDLYVSVRRKPRSGVGLGQARLYDAGG